MTFPNFLLLMAMGLVMMGGNFPAFADPDVTIVPASTAKADAATTPSGPTSADGTPVVHKSLHKKKKKKLSTASTTTSTITVPGTTPATTAKSTTASTSTTTKKKSAKHAVASTTAPITPVVSTNQGVSLAPHPVVVNASAVPSATGPTVETGLPVARHSGMDDLDPVPVPVGSSLQNPSSYRTMASSSATVSSLTTSAVGSYSTTYRAPAPAEDFPFVNFTPRTTTYPWKTGIITTIFWIGEGSSTLSSTDNIGSAWDEDWRTSNRGTDDPSRRNGYAPADHAPTLNPFYVALPFNDLAYPDKARRWLPDGWHIRYKDGKQISACKDRWVQIKNAQGRSCFAQWEDVGPLVSDHAEYVFGPERPDTLTRAGLDVSPAVAQYLGIDSTGITSWRFVDDEDVRPGEWLKYDELAVIYKAMHEMKSSTVPVQQSAEPMDDSDDPNKKRVGAAKG